MIQIPITYKDASVKIVDKLLNMMPRWMATWILDHDLKPIILLETYFADKISNSDKEGIAKMYLMETLDHKYQEARMALKLLRKEGYSIAFIQRTMTGSANPENENILDRAGEKPTK